jgi:hypothetical protein
VLNQEFSSNETRSWFLGKQEHLSGAMLFIAMVILQAKGMLLLVIGAGRGARHPESVKFVL